MVFLDFLGVQFEQGVAQPLVVLVVEVTHQSPQVFVRLDLLLALINEEVLSDRHFQVSFLLVDFDLFLSQFA